MTESATQRVMDAYLRSLPTGGDLAASFAPDVVWTFTESGEQVRGRDAGRAHPGAGWLEWGTP
jgi:hypothetical protein